MKFFVVALALFAFAAAEVAELSSEYLSPINQDYLPPNQDLSAAEPAHNFGPDGYSYKSPFDAARKRYRFRHRRDVSELAFPTQEYLPPVEQTEVLGEPIPAHTFGPDGYSYSTPSDAIKRRYRIRRRRDVSELAFPTQEYLPPVEQTEILGEPTPAHTFGPDGYSYSTPSDAIKRRYRIRRRRDVSELAFPTQEYLPPVEQTEILGEPTPAHTFGPDGYSYSTPSDAIKRRYRIRRRRDVSELAFPTQEYLPPVEQTEILGEPTPAHTFGPDGYSYSTPSDAIKRRYRIRRRRDVSELAFPTQEYLPPVEQTEILGEPTPAHTFGPDGYSYSTPSDAIKRRYRIRRRRDVSELAFPTQEYLPPVEQTEILGEPTPAHTFGPDGYSYSTPSDAIKRRYRIRRRRDVSELAFPTQEYLPPVEQTEILGEPTPAHTFGPDGYSYSTPSDAIKRRYRIRRRRDVSELAFPTQEYLPPVTQPEILGEPTPAHNFGPDGYSYSTPFDAVKRKYRFRHRH